MTKSLKHRAFCEQALVKRTDQKRSRSSVRAGFVEEFRRRALAYVSGEIAE